MKLLIILSVIACGYADKLDRTYLPPASAGSAGGSPGSLNTPLGPSTFGQPAGFNQPANFNAGKPASNFGSGPAASNAFGAPSNQYGQPGPSGLGQNAGANFYTGFNGQNLGNQQNSNYQRNQPQRAQASAEQAAEILRSDSQNDGETFSYNFETSNGISAEESGVGTNGVQAQGAFAYSDDEGQTFRVQYTADENGFQPQGDHLPTPHPIPEDILKSIEKNAQAAASGTQEGAYNPEEDNEVLTPQQYNSNAPNSYNQAASGQNFNQAGRAPSQLYGAPSGLRPQGAAPFSQGAQQYNAGSGASNGASSGSFGQSQKSPSQLYGSPSNARPNFNQQHQQYSAGPTGAARPNGFGQQGSQQSSGPSGFTASQPQRYQASQSSQSVRPQGAVQPQDASGYKYDRPQGGLNGNSNGNGQSQYRPQNGAPSGPQGFSKSSNNAFSGSNGQGSFGASSIAPNSYGSAPQSSFAPSGSKEPKAPGSFASAKLNANFGSSGSQPSFGPSNGFNRPQASGQGFRPQGQAQKSSMSDSGYEYNRPGNSGASQNNAQYGASPQNGNSQFGGQPQNNFNSNQGQAPKPGQFGAPRAPPSFSEEDGYKY